MKIHIILMGLSLSVSSLLANTSYISGTQSLSDEGYELKFENSYFQTSAFADVNGKKVTLTDDQSYISNDLILGFKYGFSANFEGLVDLKSRFNKSTENVSGSQKSFTALGLESLLMGLTYSSDRNEGFQYALKALYRKGLYTNDSYDSTKPREDIVLGDDGDGYKLGVAFSYLTTANNFYEFEINYRSPASGLSSEVLMDTKAAVTWKPATLIFGVESVMSLKQDEYTDKPTSKPQISSGSTLLYNSIDRSYTEPYVGLNFKMGQTWRLETRFAQRLMGTSTDLGNRISISLFKRVSNSNNFKNKNKAFKQYEVDGVVTKITKSRKAVMIDQGVSDGIKKGARVDFYHFDFLDGDELIGAGIVIKAGYDKSMVKVLKKYSKRKIKDGTVIRSGLIP